MPVIQADGSMDNMASCPYNVTSENYRDFIIPNTTFALQEVSAFNPTICIEQADPQFAIIYVPSEISPSLTMQNFPYTEIPSLYTPLATSSMEASGITTTFNQPFLNLRGEGTMIGFIDTGIDYRNPLFQNPDGTTRILGIWDQAMPFPEPDEISATNTEFTDAFIYGREYTQAQINEALLSSSPLDIVPSMDEESGHGTFMAGIAAGGQSPSQDFTGAAPACKIGVVKLKPAKQYLRDFFCIQDSAIAYQENDIMMGIKYLELLSIRYGMPLVIYIGLGTNYGSHEGTSPLGLMLRRINRMIGVTSVLAGGNEAVSRHHYIGHLAQAQEYEDVEIRVGAGEKGFVTELWASAPELYAIGFVSPTGQVIQRLPITNTNNTLISFVLEATQITVNYGISEFGSGSEYIFMRFFNPTPGIWRIRVYNSLFINGNYHIWLPVQGFVSEETYFLNPDPYTTITEPANVYNTITVGAYNHVNNSIYIHSSRGNNRINNVKPDLIAPGVNVYGPGLPPSASSLTFPMVRKSGTSVAAAHVAGAAASLLTWGIVYRNNISINTAAIKSYLIRGANRNPAYLYPNRERGYGSLDLYQSFLRLRE